MTERPLTLLLCALGGEGGGVLTEWLVETARHAGYPAQATSIPGVAQRTGATTYYLEVFPRRQAELGGRRPVFSLNPVPGALDAIVSSELLETVRQIGNGMATPERTRVITSSSRSLTTQERMQMGDGRLDTEALVQVVQAFSREHHLLDMPAIARECGTVVSAVMLGAVAGSGLLPFAREDYEHVVAAGGGASAKASLKGFAQAFDLVAGAQAQRGFIDAVLAPPTARVPPPQPSPRGGGSRDGAAPHGGESLPGPVQEIAALGVPRLADYQDRAYADLYLQRLQRVVDTERAAGATDFPASTEVARWLALWMAFDDIVRVADLKSRASRFARVRGEVKAADRDLLQVWDHFKPGVPEFAALLPPSLAARLIAWERRRTQAGQPAWALPLKVGTHTVTGMLALRTLARMKWLRVRGSRFATEQAMLGRWLDGVVQGLARDAALGLEIARCGRLIKGYGSTNERGKDNLLHVLDHLANGADAQAAARAIAAAREAALADEAGTALDAALRAHGAPPRPLKEQPIRWMRKPAGNTVPQPPRP